MNGSNKTIIAIVAALAVVIAAVVIFKFMSGSAVDKTAVNAEVKNASTAAAAAPAPASADTSNPAAAMLPRGKGRH